MTEKMGLLHEPHCSFFKTSSAQLTCSCRLMELYLKRDIALRDNFAGRIAEGFMATFGSTAHPSEISQKLISAIANMAYRTADAMLKERENVGM